MLRATVYLLLVLTAITAFAIAWLLAKLIAWGMLEIIEAFQ